MNLAKCGGASSCEKMVTDPKRLYVAVSAAVKLYIARLISVPLMQIM
ncbi:MAG: hypothetical protein AMDU3_IPLC00004G0058 [Thermoplasmatales archaeon I-plasma]|nr:MAG: hypothetical protein AMDU3_IPLC00004G0058 [Thermoplasmatales archaeon I-plasma]